MDLSRFSLEGQTAIVTGGSGGIGRGCANAFAQAGANIVIASVPADSVPPVVEEIAEFGTDVIGIAADVTDPQQVTDMVQQVLERFGRIDILANVAGGTYSRNPEMPQYKRNTFLDMPLEDFMTAYDVNVKSALLCARAVVPQMKLQGRGSIINTGSMSGLNIRKQTENIGAYATAKAAVHMLTTQMALQWGPEIRVNCIAPGSIDTPRAGDTRRAELEESAQTIDVGRIGYPDDIGGVAAFLASDAAAYVNGITIPVHGGV